MLFYLYFFDLLSSKIDIKKIRNMYKKVFLLKTIYNLTKITNTILIYSQERKKERIKNKNNF